MGCSAPSSGYFLDSGLSRVALAVPGSMHPHWSSGGNLPVLWAAVGAWRGGESRVAVPGCMYLPPVLGGVIHLSSRPLSELGEQGSSPCLHAPSRQSPGGGPNLLGCHWSLERKLEKSSRWVVPQHRGCACRSSPSGGQGALFSPGPSLLLLPSPGLPKGLKGQLLWAPQQ